MVFGLWQMSSSANATVSTDTLNAGHDCLIEPYVTTDVGSPTQGIVSRLLVDRGAYVKRGQAIVELEASMERAAAKQAAARTEMLGEVLTRSADLELAKQDSRRFSDLHARGLAPEQQRDEAVAREKVANAALVQALDNQTLSMLELDRTRLALEQRTIKSPVDGVVVNPLVFPGELVYDNPIMTVAQLDPLRIEVVLPARLFGSIKAGDTGRITPEIDTDAPLAAIVDVVDPLLDSRSGSFGVRLLLPNADLTVAAGQKCRVSFITDDGGGLAPAGNPQRDYLDNPSTLGAAVPPNPGTGSK
jgi:RND family efflux transporter MFP subunit